MSNGSNPSDEPDPDDVEAWLDAQPDAPCNSDPCCQCGNGDDISPCSMCAMPSCIDCMDDDGVCVACPKGALADVPYARVVAITQKRDELYTQLEVAKRIIAALHAAAPKQCPHGRVIGGTCGTCDDASDLIDRAEAAEALLVRWLWMPLLRTFSAGWVQFDCGRPGCGHVSCDTLRLLAAVARERRET